jgi:serine/threonine protein kinase
MSPEQVRGEEVNARSDLFSLSVLLYEMAAGVLPFRGDTSGVIFDGILNRAPTPLARSNPEIPPGLERIIEKGLEKDRSLRYQHAADIRSDLQRLKRDTETSRIKVQGATAAAVAPPWWRRKSVLFSAGVLAAAALAGWIALRPQTKAIDSLAVLPSISATEFPKALSTIWPNFAACA